MVFASKYPRICKFLMTNATTQTIKSQYKENLIKIPFPLSNQNAALLHKALLNQQE